MEAFVDSSKKYRDQTRGQVKGLTDWSLHLGLNSIFHLGGYIMSEEKEMTYEEKQGELERRLKNTNIDGVFHDISETVTLQTTDELDSDIFAGVEVEFKSSLPIRLKEDGCKVAGMELKFQL